MIVVLGVFEFSFFLVVFYFCILLFLFGRAYCGCAASAADTLDPFLI